MLRGARVVRRRRLLRAAAVGGLAHRAGKHIEQNREAAPAPSFPTPDMHVKLRMLDELGTLREHGVLSDEEFARQKQHVLEG